MLRPTFWAASLLLAPLLSASPQEVASPKDFLGYELGRRFTTHARLVDYVDHVARSSSRVSVERYGATTERRPLILATITSEANRGRLAELLQGRAKLSDPRLLAAGDDPAQLVSTLPALVWLSYNVHGNESSPSETAMAVLHRLATANDPDTLRWLESLIIVLDPCVNPDGRDRYVNWFHGLAGEEPDPDPEALEHQEPWPNGRFNHYLFDLNRDWAFATQVETRSRLPRFVELAPQVHVDFHEMSYESSYFFFPAEKPVNSNLPASITRWGRAFGRGNAEAFDRRGWTYFTEEDFDLFYPGYGDSWPSFQGAIGMTYEQGGGGRAGLLVRRRDGSTVSLLERLHHHEIATYATLDTSAKNRQALLSDYRDFRVSALEEGRTGPVRAYLLPPLGDPQRLADLAITLERQGITARCAKEAFSMRLVTDSTGAAVLDRTFERGTLVVPCAQPTKRLLTTLLEPRTKIQELSFYDVSAWSLPFAYGVTAYQAPALPDVELIAIADALNVAGGVDAGEAQVGWLLEYESRGALFALADLLAANLRVRSARKGFSFGDRAFARGTLLVRRSENAPDVASKLESIGERRGVRFLPASTGYTDEGIDLGSQSVVPILRPRLAVVGGDKVSPTSFGAVRHLLAETVGFPHTALSYDRLAAARLDRFTAVVLPESSLPDSAREPLKRFVEDGGVLIALGRSAFALTGGGDGALSKVRPSAAPAVAVDSTHRWIEQRQEDDRREQQPGSVFRLDLDPAHPLSFGYRSELAVFKEGTESFDPSGPGLTIGRFKDAEPLSGYVSDRAATALRGKGYVVVEPRGRGTIVLFAEDPNFRGTWCGMTRLFLNATLLLSDRRIPVE